MGFESTRSLLRKRVTKATRDEGADSIRKHEGHVHLREDDLIDTLVDEVHLHIGICRTGTYTGLTGQVRPRCAGDRHAC